MMSPYREPFPNAHTFLAVVHAETLEQTLRNVSLAQEGGADGAFLINHSVSPRELIDFYQAAHTSVPGFWLGMNILNHDPTEALDMLPDLQCGLWSDNAGIRNSGDYEEARWFQTVRTCDSHWRGLYFGGVAFKYQEHIDDPAAAARIAIPFVDVITTSGEGTGFAPDVEKIRAMKEAIGDHPLAIASGISPENVRTYLPYADCFLVATELSDSHTELNLDRVRMFARAIR